MAALVISRIKVTDPEKYETYRPLAKAAIEKYGGRYLVRGAEALALEGTLDAARHVVVEFDSVETVREFYDSPEYRLAREARAGAAEAVITAVQGI